MIKHNPKTDPPPKDRTILADFGKGTMLTRWEHDKELPHDSQFGCMELIVGKRGVIREFWWWEDEASMLCWWDLPKGGE